MFILLPIFAIYAINLPNTPTEMQIGLALGIYGLTQALFQIPFGIASDIFGRKPLIYFGLELIYNRVINCGLHRSNRIHYSWQSHSGFWSNFCGINCIFI